MLLTINQKTVLLASAIACSVCGVTQAQPDTQKIAINFAAYVGEAEFACGDSYEEVGTTKSTITPKDFRFYVSNLALIDEAGNAIPLKLSQDGKWQYQNTALLDFEDGTKSCDNGTAEINTKVVGTIPAGDYQSLQFTLGVPQKLNHSDAAIAPSPLNLTSMWWNWQGGYKFLRVDLETAKAISNVSNHHSNSTSGQVTHGQNEPNNVQLNEQTDHQEPNGEGTTSAHAEEAISSNAYLIHLGSTGCSASAQSNLFGCANPNRVQVMLEDFNPKDDVVIADLGELLAQSDLSTNQANTPNGCMSSPEDGDCVPIMQNLNLSAPNNSAGDATQYFFFVE
jgi:uncharacterized repeat protein (TIGR04052 family)